KEGDSEGNSYIEKLLKREIPRDALISPIYASSDQLRQLPPMWFIACHMDPLLDDTISFARKVRACGGRVKSVDLLDSLPHGFLNFTLMSPECREGAKLCLMRIKQALGFSDSASTLS
ncbi:Hormone-sensitive lipase, partial [Toxocara canis]